MTFLILIAGFSCLIFGADRFVEGSSSLAKNFNVPSLIIGLTVVALGTSAPELAVSTVAAVHGANEIALSNVIGSNIFNLLCCLGMCALFHQVPVDGKILRRDFPLTILATLLILIIPCIRMAYTRELFHLNMNETAGTISRSLAAFLLLLFIAYIAYLIFDSRKNPAPETDDIPALPVWKCLLYIAVGISLIIGGGEAVLYSAKEIARAAGMTETLIGLTIVAIGTSLPELVTTVVAARKGETGLAFGNAIGSNIFNLMFILGISAAIHPIAVNLASVFDLGILLVITLLCYVFSRSGRKLDRTEGIVMLLLYMADILFAIYR